MWVCERGRCGSKPVLFAPTQCMSLLVARKHHIFTPVGREAADEVGWVGGWRVLLESTPATQAYRRERRVG